MFRRQELLGKLLKYLSVGALSNALAYGFYIGMTLMGSNPIFSMSLAYAMAGGLSFVANKDWTFQSSARISKSLSRYLTIQLIGYATNFLMFTGLYIGLGVPHYFAQLVGIGIVAIEMFLLSRYYVFS